MGGSRRLADTAAPIGLAFALLSLLAVGALYFSGPIADWLQGPDPCGAVKGKSQPDTACAQAHRDYYVSDPSTGYLDARGSLISQTVEAVAWPGALPLGLAAALSAWLALAMRTRRRGMAITALTVGSLIVVWAIVLVVGLALGGGD